MRQLTFRMDDDRSVKINTDPAGEVGRLHGIGPTLAAAIVRCRDEHGYFHGPEDLARVRGVSLNLAEVLAPHIDWQTPTAPEQPKQRSWPGAALAMLLVAVAGASFIKVADRWRQALMLYLSGDPTGWSKICFNGLFAIGAAFILAACCFFLGAQLTRSRHRWRRFSRIFLVCIAAGAFSGPFTICLLVGVEAYTDASALLKTVHDHATGFLSIAVISLGLGLWFAPPLLVIRWPTLASKPLAAVVYESGILLVACVMVLNTWLNLAGQPLWLLAAQAIFGILYLSLGLHSILTDQWMFTTATKSILAPLGAHAGRAENDVLIRWVNRRLPDPATQKALKQALEKTYPASRRRTFLRWIVVVTGGWLLAAVLGAIVDWAIGRWLDQLRLWFQHLPTR